MKKFLIITAVASSLVCAKSYAGEFYVSPSIALTNVETKKVNPKDDSVSEERGGVSTRTTSFGVEAGYRFEIGKFFIGPELYYYNFGASLNGYQDDNSVLLNINEVKLEDTTGLALNLGYRFTKKFAAYTRLGFGVTNYTINYDIPIANMSNITEDGSDLAALFSIGTWYDINKNVALKVSYDTVDLGAMQLGAYSQSLSVGAIFKF